MTNLRPSRPNSKQLAMIARRSRFVILAAALSVVALFGFVVVSSWHSAVVHDDAVSVAMASAAHDSHDNSADPDAPIHVAAHAAAQGMVVAPETVAPKLVYIDAIRWPTADDRGIAGSRADRLMRPPRA
jgi:hypothetical protein